MTDIIKDELATKNDVRELRLDKRDEMKQLEHRLTMKFGSMMVAQTTIVIAIVALILKS
jgi:hypothetical protein